jgi:hypothetical protein
VSAEGTAAAGLAVSGQEGKAVGRNVFEMKEGARVDLGNARLVSNLSSSYSVQVHSANDERGTKVEYRLSLGDNTVSARGGSFRFAASGKSTRAGTALPVGLSIPRLPAGAASGFYTDSLFFSVSAN